MVVSPSVQLWQFTPFVLIYTIHLAGESSSESATRSRYVLVTNSAGGVTVSWVLQICHVLKHEFVSLLKQLAALNVTLCILVLIVTSANHVNTSW